MLQEQGFDLRVAFRINISERSYMTWKSQRSAITYDALKALGKKHALNKYNQFALNTSCFWRSTESNITPVMQFHEIFVVIKNNTSVVVKFNEIFAFS